MNANPHTLPAVISAFRIAILSELGDAVRKIHHCVDQLSDDQLWWRPNDAMNSIANLMLHITGNAHQWIVAGLSGTPDQRNRPQEFAQRDGIPRERLLQMLDSVAREVKGALADASPAELTGQRKIQGFDVTGMQAVVESIAHFRGHTQEIVHLTRIQLGDAYQYDFVPRADQQGGAAQ